MRLAPVLLLLAACAGAPPLGAPAPDSSWQIYGSPPEYPFHDAVVATFNLYGTQLGIDPQCTGTLIAPDVVLTAAHCLDDAWALALEPILTDPRDIAVFVGDDAYQPDRWARMVAVVETAIHPDYDRWAIRNDIGLMRLERSVPGVTPVPHLPAALGFTPADAGALVDHAGFGFTETYDYGVKYHVTAPLDGGPGCAVPGCPSPGDPATQVSFTMAAGGPCLGDSGGPMFVARGADVYVGSITSWGDPGCTVYGVNQRVDILSAEIDAWIAAAPEAPPLPGPGTCGDGVCNALESCDGRGPTEPCAADCPGVLVGGDRYCWVQGSCFGNGCP